MDISSLNKRIDRVTSERGDRPDFIYVTMEEFSDLLVTTTSGIDNHFDVPTAYREQKATFLGVEVRALSKSAIACIYSTLTKRQLGMMLVDEDIELRRIAQDEMRRRYVT